MTKNSSNEFYQKCFMLIPLAFISNMKNIEGNVQAINNEGSVSSKYRAEPEIKKSNVNDILN